MYGAFTLTEEEIEALESGSLPEEWKRYFVSAELQGTDRPNLYQIRANNVGSPLYLELASELAYVADSVQDIDRIAEVRTGRSRGIRREWSLEREWGGHVFLSDGGVLNSIISDSNEFPDAGKSVEMEISWETSGDVSSGQARWHASGVGNIINASFINALKTHDWSQADIFIPDPLIAALGINMPNPGRNTSSLPRALSYLAEQLRHMGLRNAEIQALMTGPATFSVGGRTQLLWFELPGLVLDLPGRGEPSLKLLNKFWTEVFVGTEPKPVEGYTHGGTTDIPFTVLAVGNDEKTVIGLSAADVEQNLDVRDLLSGATSAAGWLFVDFPRLGASLAEMPAINSMIYEDEEGPLDVESAVRLRDAMNTLGRLFVTFDSGSSGSALWYY
jgi:hypothetical protein